MSNEMLSPLVGSTLRVENKEQLEEFLARPDAAHVVRSASFEEVFFTIKHIGLADSLDLLPLVSGKQVRGFIDLDCWRKDTFVRKPFMEWIAACIQAGPEETMKAISGIDATLTALFLKDLINIYEIDRDDPPTGTQLIFTPDNRFAVEPLEEGEATTIGMLILDALFKYNPALGTQILSANLVNLGELEGIRPALGEMRDFLTIGLEYLTGSRADLAAHALRQNYIQTIFKVGFDQVARLRDEADRLAHIRRFN